MTTQPPSPEAVEAAMKWVSASDWKLPQETCIRSFTQVGYWALPEEKLEAAARILAAEVERLRGKADAVCEWQEVEETNTSDWYYETECEKEYGYDHDPRLTNHPHCPGCGRKVKIQPQTDEDQ